jgi:hypothetical protein
VGGIGPGKAPDPGTIVVTESRQQVGILFGFLALAAIVALVRRSARLEMTRWRMTASCPKAS